MTNFSKPLPNHTEQQAQLSWLQSYNGEWSYFFDDSTTENLIEDYIWLVNQTKSAHKVRGYRIENHQIEAVVEQLTAVNKVVVFGVPHEQKGNGIHVYASLSDAAIDLSMLSQAINAKLAGFFGDFAQPEVIKFVGELPQFNNKKMSRQILKNQAMNVYCAA